MNLSCVIIDDEPKAISVIEKHIAEVPFLELLNSFRSPVKALEFLQRQKVDLIFLDINMPILTGIQFLKVLVKPPMIIFTTAYSEYALDGFEYNALDFLMKPIEFDRFLKAVNKALEQWQLSQGKELSIERNTSSTKTINILIKRSGESRKINCDEILFIESAGNYIIVVTNNEKIMAHMTMNDTMSLLPEYDFHRVHRSYIISLKNIIEIQRNAVKVAHKNIPIGKHYREGFLKSINKLKQ